MTTNNSPSDSEPPTDPFEPSRREFREVWNNNNPDAIESIYTPDFRGHGFPLNLSMTRRVYKVFVEQFQCAFPDGNMELCDIRADEEFVYADWEFTGTHTGSILGEPPSYASVTITGTGRHRYHNDRVAEVWLDVDWSQLFTPVFRGYLSRATVANHDD